MLYPHEFDRHHLIGLIFKAFRKDRGWNQHAMARYADLNQAVISTLETLPEARRILSRNDLIKAMKAFKIKRPGKSVNAVLWLFDGDFLSKNERETYGFKKTAVGESEEFENRDVILRLLNQAMRYYKRMPGNSVSVVSDTEEDELSIQREFLEIESGKGIRILMKRTPSSLTCPSAIYEKALSIPKKITTKSGKDFFLSTRKKRILNYLDKIGVFGDRCIHVEDDIKNYLTAKNTSTSFSQLDRRKHIENMIHLLEEYPKHYQIKLVPMLPLFEYGMKGFDRIVATAEFYPSNFQLVRYIQLFGEQSVLPYLLEFENLWGETLKDQPDNNTVIDKLHMILKSTE